MEKKILAVSRVNFNIGVSLIAAISFTRQRGQQITVKVDLCAVSESWQRGCTIAEEEEVVPAKEKEEEREEGWRGNMREEGKREK